MAVRLLEIDALRGLAALAVAFFFHIHHLLGYYRTGPLDGLPLFSWLHDYGFVLVDLFFVVSGFIFAYVYLPNGRLETDARTFAAARFARLYPLHLVTLLAAAAVLAVGPSATAEGCCNDAYHFALNLAMLQETGLNEGMSFNTPSWSISVEVLCYILFYLVAALAPARFWHLAFVLCAAGLLGTMSGDAQFDHIARGLCGFFAGNLAYRLRSVTVGLWLALLPAGFLVADLVPGLAFGAVLAVTSWPAAVNLARRVALLRSPALVWLGDRSYSIYLIHSPLYMAINVLVFSGEAVPPSLTVPLMLAGWVLLLALADLSFRYLESPARRALTQRLLRARRNSRRPA